MIIIYVWQYNLFVPVKRCGTAVIDIACGHKKVVAYQDHQIKDKAPWYCFDPPILDSTVDKHTKWFHDTSKDRDADLLYWNEVKSVTYIFRCRAISPWPVRL